MGFTDIRAGRLWAATALAVAATVGSAGGAVADDITNDIDAAAEVMPLNVGGSNGSTVLTVQPRNGDGDAGCNFEPGGGSLTISLSSSDTDVATVSPSSATFTGCGSTATLTITPVATGTATISAGQVSNTTLGSFNLAPATFTVDVAGPANTAPTISVEGVDEGASYDKGSVPDATCVVTDAEDGPSSFPASLSGSLDADGLGQQTASCGYTDAGRLVVSTSETYSIVDSSAPVISYTLDPTNPDGLDSWYRSAVTLTWHVSDPDSPSSLQTLSGCQDQSITADQLATSYSCSASSSGGTTGPVSVSVKRDGNGPSVGYTSASPAAPDGDNDWYVSPVTATFTATDGFSGPASQTGTTTSSSDGSAVVLASPAFSDNAGNTTAAGAAQSAAFQIDTVAPSVGDAALSGTEGDNGWYTSAVTASFTGTDHTSGVAGDNPRTSSTGTSQGEVTLLSPEFKDVAGNTTEAGAKSATVKVDTVAPSLSLVGGPADGESYYFGSVPTAPACEASDETSHLAGACTVSGYGNANGPHTVTASVTDNAGNTSTVSRTYTVLAWTTKGFYSPVDMNGVYNTVKGGSTVPLKFELFAGPTELTDVSAVKSFTTQKITCSGDALADAIEVTTTGGTSLRYDATGGQFVQNWKTPTGAGTCYRATMTAQDGSAISALFKIK